MVRQMSKSKLIEKYFKLFSEPHNIIQFYINYRSFPELQRFFTVDELTGVLSVNLFGDSELDRDNGEPEHFIRINFDDNFQGNGGKFSFFFFVTSALTPNG